MDKYKQLFLQLYREVAACEAPEGTQVDDVLASYQPAFEEAMSND